MAPEQEKVALRRPQVSVVFRMVVGKNLPMTVSIYGIGIGILAVIIIWIVQEN
jgi:hypothetical protein